MWKVLLPIGAVAAFALALFAAKKLLKESGSEPDDYCAGCGCQRNADRCPQCGKNKIDPTLRDPDTLY